MLSARLLIRFKKIPLITLFIFIVAQRPVTGKVFRDSYACERCSNQLPAKQGLRSLGNASSILRIKQSCVRSVTTILSPEY